MLQSITRELLPGLAETGGTWEQGRDRSLAKLAVREGGAMDQESRIDTFPEDPAAGEKRPYVKPELQVYGDLSVTRLGGTAQADAFAAS